MISANTISAGQLLCGGLFSADSLSNWFAAVAMLHAVLGNTNQREQLLRVQLATSLGNPPVSLLQQCCNMLSQVTFFSHVASLWFLSKYQARKLFRFVVSARPGNSSVLLPAIARGLTPLNLMHYFQFFPDNCCMYTCLYPPLSFSVSCLSLPLNHCL